MKNNIAKVTILLLIGSLGLQAQKFKLGVHFSPTFNWISTTQSNTDNNLSLKYSFGLIGEYAFATNYSLLSGIDINRRGGSLAAGGRTGDYSAGFIQVPIALKLRTREFGYLTYFAKFGGSLGVKTGESVSFDPALTASDVSLDKYVSSLNGNFVFGFGTEYSLGGQSAILVGIDYNRSLFDNLIDDDPRLSKNATYRFDYINLTLGFLF
jgi:hypothetical protein